MRAEPLTAPSAPGDEGPGEPLHQAVRGIRAEGAHRPERLAAEPVRSRDPVLRAGPSG
ncbi:hypothetical protein [Streptomyces sp. B1I3]|uniref:hypothetical protein n=1 Tax=Streptomyces sp. B1I3 TaxID=3042264 RepID=UPI0027878D44|nr:hypothetical protein [Streptomyces sp. B1I3]MDQ0797857.1 hypothetical protein [Streptomyces sp. B1I3]